ncbi:MAG: hypothetical protein JSS02_15465, partial [Planctomycetes bacterium]|nr:hypothetical protein [Planctomycetota bacterium]
MAKTPTRNSRPRRPRSNTSPSDLVPVKATLRAYRVGFGDCFLLTFEYASGDSRHVLIDFGTTRLPIRSAADEQKKTTQVAKFHLEVAERIAAVCGPKLHVVVATHRHKDHISGFATGSPGKRLSGDIIRGLKPDLVILPWTEDPQAAVDATGPTKTMSKAPNALHAAGLSAMQSFAGQILASAEQEIAQIKRRNNGQRVPRDLERLRFLGEDNLSNKSAVENLLTMGSQRLYAAYGTPIDLSQVLPGVQVRVLGPPTL